MTYGLEKSSISHKPNISVRPVIAAIVANRVGGIISKAQNFYSRMI